ncbi:GDSL-type esterase/lipase family protein [Sphingomonas faeni]|nr:GDSL-type esterase/lipase family protein [Sphingomonas faeni]
MTAGLVDDRRHQPIWAIIGKLCLALIVFGSVFGGWLFVMQSRAETRDAAARLPGDGSADRCAIWFIGSSSIHKWTTLEPDMMPWDALNRGVNGARMPELLQMLRNEPRGSRPRAIVYYAGENDIAKGASAAEDVVNLRAFLAFRMRRWGDVPVVVVALKPSPTRWGNLPEQTLFNTAARTIAARTPGVTFVDVVPYFLVDHRPGPFYVDDGVHLNSAGYARLTRAIRPALQSGLKRGDPAPCPQRTPRT